ncbi:MAG: hypothetical protein JXA19_04765 [Anaerolineales bacterium]|nr:hypothetical protein [Anaerolineales bacterium]
MTKRQPFLSGLILIFLTLSSCETIILTPTPADDAGAKLTLVVQTVEAERQQHPTDTPTITPTPTPIPEGTLTPTPTATPTRDPCNLVVFVVDVTIQDGTEIPIGDAFTKTWRFRNEGSCVWNTGYKLAFYYGDQMDGPDTVPFPDVIPPGAEMEISVDLISPSEPGIYRGYWMFQTPGGAYFGLEEKDKSFYVDIVAIPGPTPSPRPSITPSPSPTLTPKPGPDIVIIGYSLNPFIPLKGKPATVVIQIENKGEQPANPHALVWWANIQDEEPACVWPVDAIPPGETRMFTCEYTYPKIMDEVVTRVIVDDTNLVTEMDEENNTVSITIEVINP